MNGLLPEATASGSGASGELWERSSSQDLILVSKDAEEGPALLAVVVADGSGAPYIAAFARCGLEHVIVSCIFLNPRIQHRALRDWSWFSEYDGQRHLGVGVRQGA